MTNYDGCACHPKSIISEAFPNSCHLRIPVTLDDEVPVSGSESLFAPIGWRLALLDYPNAREPMTRKILHAIRQSHSNLDPIPISRIWRTLEFAVKASDCELCK